MEPILSLFEQAEHSQDGLLTAELAGIYGSNLYLRQSSEGDSRPFVYANFVSSLDGVVSYDLPEYPNGSIVGGGSEGDRFILCLLRACAEAVIVGWSSVRSEGGTARTATAVDPARKDLYKRLRQQMYGDRRPLNVILSNSGRIDFSQALFHDEEVDVLILAAEDPDGRIANAAASLPHTACRLMEGPGGLDPLAALQYVQRTYRLRRCLLEGGPKVMGSFLRDNCVDELFLTLSPRLAGRSDENPRPGLAAGFAFDPPTSPAAALVSLRRQGDYLFSRYRIGIPSSTAPRSHT